MTALWNRILEHFISLLVPPLSDIVARTASLSPPEIDVLFKWLQQLKAFFNAKEANGVEYGIPLGVLQGGRYRDVITLGQYLDLPGQALKERVGAAVRSVRGTGGGGGGKGGGVDAVDGVDGLIGGMQGLVLMGVAGEEQRMAEILLRIARTRSDMGEFLRQQVELYNRLRLEG